MNISCASYEDLKEILDLQYVAYQSEADLFGTRDIPPLKQTLEDVQEEFRSRTILKMTDDSNTIVGSVRAIEKDGTVFIGKLMVHPRYQGRGYGSKLLKSIEERFPGRRYELFTSTRSIDNIRLYNKHGYKEFDRKEITDELIFVYMEKLPGNNPWEDISLDDYESHMSLESVNQLQTLNSIMKEQFGLFPAGDVMILGVAGGNGLEHVDTGKYKTVYGVDINERYLVETQKRHPELKGILKCIHMDIIKDADKLPRSGFVIADLLIEYIGLDAFVNALSIVEPSYVSIVIQINMDDKDWVSDSPYLHSFDRLDEVHHQMESSVIESVMSKAGYLLLSQNEYPLPNGKALLRMDLRLNT